MQLKATKPAELAALGELLKKFPKARATAVVPSSRELLVELLKSSLWPEAVPEAMVVKDEPTKKIRASSIISSFIKQPVKDKKVLDFGCGDGYCVAEAKRVGADAIGYDIEANEQWTKFEGVKFTNDFTWIQQNAPYDVILLYDVLDHCVDTDPVELLKKVAGLMSKNTRLYVRFHPFTSPHGTHMYFTLNKAYAHLLFTDEELAAAGGKQETTVRLNKTVSLYNDWIQQAGLNLIGKPSKVMIPPSDFFKDDLICQEILDRHFKTNPVEKDVLLKILSVHFVDYVLTRSETPFIQNV